MVGQTALLSSGFCIHQCLGCVTAGLVKGEDVRHFTIWDLFESVPESQVRQPLTASSGSEF